jgi:hypothetical protein
LLSPSQPSLASDANQLKECAAQHPVDWQGRLLPVLDTPSGPELKYYMHIFIRTRSAQVKRAEKHKRKKPELMTPSARNGQNFVHGKQTKHNIDSGAQRNENLPRLASRGVYQSKFNR